MLGKLLITAALSVTLAGMLAFPSCNSNGSAGQLVKATWITPDINADKVSIPASDIDKYTIVHFWVDTPAGKQSFMAYKLNGTKYVRADVCVPCGSTSFSLQKDILKCDTCGTKFNALTGKGVIQKGCGAYAKATVNYKLDGGKLVMTIEDLQAAYASSLQYRPA